MLAGTNRGALTNVAGRYVIPNVLAGTYQVRVVVLGFSQQTQTVTVSAGQAVVANFTMSVSAIQIDGISVNVITGESQRARELGTNNGKISIEDIAVASATSLEDVLSGRVEGLGLNGVGGTIGTGQKIRVRGANSISLSNEPLVFVDGVLFSSLRQDAIVSSFSRTGGVGGQDTSRLDDLNPNDIVSIEVLKGPAATGLYGTQAANGVLLITTKKGTEHGVPVVATTFWWRSPAGAGEHVRRVMRAVWSRPPPISSTMSCRRFPCANACSPCRSASDPFFTTTPRSRFFMGTARSVVRLFS